MTTFTFMAASPSAAIPADQIVNATVTNVTSGTLYILIAAGDPAIASVANFAVTGTTSGQATLSAGYPAKLGMGTHTTTFTVTACLNDATCATGGLMGSPATITVHYQVGSPVQQDTLMPALGFTNTPGHVILRGSGFTGVTGAVFGSNAAIIPVTVVNDTEIDVDYPAMAAEIQSVTLKKGATDVPFGAGFIVADPLTPSATTLAVPTVAGTQFIVNSLAFDEVNGALLAGMSTLDTSDPMMPPVDSPQNNVILHYFYTAGIWSTALPVPWPNLRTIALAPDAQTVLAATDQTIDWLDAVGLTTVAPPSTKPSVMNEYIRKLAFTNDGNVVVATGYANGTGSTSAYLYSLFDASFAQPKLTGSGQFATNLFYYADTAASADGSVTVLAEHQAPVPIQRYLAATGRWVASAATYNYYTPAIDGPSGVVIDARADRLIFQDNTGGLTVPNLLVMDAALLQTGIAALGSEAVLISPDGSHAYVLAITLPGPSTCSVRRFDLTVPPSTSAGFYTEFTSGGYPISRPCLSDINSPSVGALSPDGKTLFVAGGTSISVIPLP